MDIDRLFRTDPEKEAEGVTFPLGDGAEITLRRQGNPLWIEQRRKKQRLYRQGYRGGVMSDEAAEELLLDLLAETVIVGWTGLTVDGGKPLPFSVATARRLLTEMRDFRDFVANASSEMEAYRRDAEREEKKHSVTPLGGSSAGAETESS